MAERKRIVQVTRTPGGAQVVLEDGQTFIASAKENDPQDLENLIENLDGAKIKLKPGAMLK